MKSNLKQWVLNILWAVMLILVGMSISTEKVQNQCDKFVIDNYFTLEMQQCLYNEGSIFKTPYGTINMSGEEYAARNIYNFSGQ